MQRKSSPKNAVCAIAIAFALIAISVPLSHPAAATTGSTGLIVPLYSYPGSAWTTLIQEKEANPSVPMIAIVNPDNGPGSYDPNYAYWIDQLMSAGIDVVGYIPTEYAAVDVGTVESQVASYQSMYGVSGIFLDQMSNVPGYEWYYSTITSYAHSIGAWLVVGNPGAPVPSSYVGTVDIIVLFENGYLPTQPWLQSITMGDGPSGFAVMSYDSPLSMSQVSLEASYVSYIYITDGVWPSPYSSLPSYFADLVSDVAYVSSSGGYTISVQSITSSGSPQIGMYTVIYSDGYVVDTGFTPLNYTGSAGSTYLVCVDNYLNINFTNWGDGTTSSCYSVGLSQNVALTATYDV